MLRACFSLAKRPVEPCKFCEYAGGKSDRELLYDDDLVVVFRSRNPVAASHLLVVPKQHIGTVRDLNRSHASLLFHMDKVGRHVLAANHGNASSPSSSHSHPERVYGFHRPPFNSVQHLHLHCIGLPWSNFFEPVRFQTGAPWFVPVGVLLKSLLIEKE